MARALLGQKVPFDSSVIYVVTTHDDYVVLGHWSRTLDL